VAEKGAQVTLTAISFLFFFFFIYDDDRWEFSINVSKIQNAVKA